MRRRLLWVVGVVTFAGIVAVAVAVPVTTVNRARNRVQLQSRNTPGPAGGTNAANAAAAQPPPAGSPARNSGNSPNVAAASATRSALVPPNTAAPEYQAPGRACNGVKGLCEVPVRYALFGGTHNSNSIRAVPAVFENQKLGFLAQLQQGVRVFDLDYSGQSNGRFAHCANCFCGYAPAAADALASSVFNTMGDFLTANPTEVLVLGMSNVNCGSANGGVAGARAELLGALAQSSLNQYLPSSAVGPDTTLGQLVDSGQRALLVFYDQWGNTAGHTVGDKVRAVRWHVLSSAETSCTTCTMLTCTPLNSKHACPHDLTFLFAACSLSRPSLSCGTMEVAPPWMPPALLPLMQLPPSSSPLTWAPSSAAMSAPARQP